MKVRLIAGHDPVVDADQAGKSKLTQGDGREAQGILTHVNAQGRGDPILRI